MTKLILTITLCTIAIIATLFYLSRYIVMSHYAHINAFWMALSRYLYEDEDTEDLAETQDDEE